MAKPAEVTQLKKRALMATAGGNATASGVSFQASVAAYFASQGLAGIALDARLGLGSARVTGLRFETEAPVDDVLVNLDTDGRVFIQGKNSLTSSTSLSSELGKTCDELARLWEATFAGKGTRGWDRPLVSGVDCMVIAVGPTTSGTIKHHLARALDIARNGSTETLSQEQTKALDGFRKLTAKAFAARGGALADVDPDVILKFVYILDFDFAGPHRTAAETVLGNALNDRHSAPAALAVLERECERRMAARNGISLAGLRSELGRSGVPISAPANYLADIASLKDRTARVGRSLQDFERTHVSGTDITISRQCTANCVEAAKQGSLVVIGDPGAGKSAVVNEAARQLGAEGSDVVLLAIDRLQVESVEGLSAALGISHPLAKVLANWPGNGPGYLVLDALDACRFGRSEALFRTVMQEVLELDQGRWRIVASIRTFDLMIGQEFARLFRGVPASTEFTDLRFQGVRHIKVPEWSDAEFEELLTKIPALRIAIDNGGQKLLELAKVPFNTRLLADLLTDGVEPEQLQSLRSQVQLLEMYWNERVRPLGPLAEQCLGTTVKAMIDQGRMEATRMAAGAGTGNALDELLQRGVLISVNGDREVAFRHHILFDYTASRTIIELNDSRATDKLLKQTGASLLLAPALSFALQHLWETSGPGRDRFWQSVVELAGDSSADPIARSVAARVGCDLPSEDGDIASFLRLMSHREHREKAFTAFRHLVGSLAVRLEDDEGVPPAPWCLLAESGAAFVTTIAWPLRTLINALVNRVKDPGLRSRVGVAARAVMDHAFDAAGGEMLMAIAIEFVAKTFGTNAAASRKLVERLLEPGRMKEHAASDMHWLANHVGDIAEHDPALVVQIYDRVFDHTVEEDGPTQLGQSKILALTSNRRQDFKMSQWALKEAYAAFAESHYLEATEIAIKIARSYIRNEHSLSIPVETTVLSVGQQVGHVVEDYSYIWASEHRAAYSDDAVQIIDSFVEMLEKLSDIDAIAVADRLIAENRYAWLWNRLLRAAASRGGALATKLWFWAIELVLLRSANTMEPALDLIVSQYSQRSPSERRQVEETILAAVFPTSARPAEAAQDFRREVFGAIGRDALETQDAKDIVDDASASGMVVNDHGRRHRNYGFMEHEEYSWLSDKGVDVEAEPNRSILTAITLCQDAVSKEANQKAGLAAIQDVTAELAKAGTAAHALVRVYGWERVTWGIERLTADFAMVNALTESQREGIETLLALIGSQLAELSAMDKGLANSAWANTAATTMNIVRDAPEATARLSGKIRSYATDAAANVRNEIAMRLSFLWNTDKALMWDLVANFAKSETNARVMVQLVNFLIRLSNQEPDRVVALTQTILTRTDVEKGDGRDTFREGIGTLVFHLWTRHGQPTAREIIDLWLGDRGAHAPELRHGAFSIRDGLTLGYDSTNGSDHETRARCQKLAFDVIDRAARGIEGYFALGNGERTEERNAAASEDAALLDQMSDQFFYAVGAIQIQKGEEPRALREISDRKQFLRENRATFRMVGDVGTPSSIYHLLQLLDFLSSADPAEVFDLASHALLHAGKLHGYQSESLGAAQFVTMIGRTIADHRELFDDPVRRMALVEVLEAFVDVGWPAARRLLYRLPEALR